MDEKLKIIQSCGSPSWGGLEIMALETSKELINKGHDVVLFCRKNSTLYNEAQKSGIKSFEVFDKDKYLFGSIRKIKTILNTDKYEIIHTHYSHDLWALVPALKRNNLKLFLTKHVASIPKKDLLHRYLYKRVNGLFAISNYIKECVIEKYPVPKERIFLLHDFINLKNFDKSLYNKSETRKVHKIPENAIVIGMAGRISPGKGHEDFIDATKIILKNNSQNIYFVIIGGASHGEDEYGKKIKLYAKESGIADKIIFTGFSSEIPKLLNILDIFVLPSHEESFGIIVLEAMAIGLPVIATNNAGAVDIVVNNETGILLEPKKPGQIAEAVQKLMDDKNKRDNFGTAGRKRIEEVFSTDIIISQLLEYYKTL